MLLSSSPSPLPRRGVLTPPSCAAAAHSGRLRLQLLLPLGWGSSGGDSASTAVWLPTIKVARFSPGSRVRRLEATPGASVLSGWLAAARATAAAAAAKGSSESSSADSSRHTSSLCKGGRAGTGVQERAVGRDRVVVRRRRCASAAQPLALWQQLGHGLTSHGSSACSAVLSSRFPVTGAAPQLGRLGVSGKVGCRCHPEEQSSAAGSGTEAAAAKGDTAVRLLAAKDTVRDDMQKSIGRKWVQRNSDKAAQSGPTQAL
jgi:hypothetical protein